MSNSSSRREQELLEDAIRVLQREIDEQQDAVDGYVRTYQQAQEHAYAIAIAHDAFTTELAQRFSRHAEAFDGVKREADQRIEHASEERSRLLAELDTIREERS